MVTFSQQPTAPTAGPATPTTKKARGGNKFLPLIAVAVVVVLIAGGYWFLKGRGGGIVSGEYQAVFISNGQVYFGKITKTDASEVVLKDVYYLMIRRPVEVQTQTPEATPGAQPGGVKYELRKLGEQEMHGPMDEMRINRKHVLFVEDLKEDSMVVQAIQQHKAQQQQQEQE